MDKVNHVILDGPNDAAFVRLEKWLEEEDKKSEQEKNEPKK